MSILGSKNTSFCFCLLNGLRHLIKYVFLQVYVKQQGWIIEKIVKHILGKYLFVLLKI